ncbi:MAG: bifunctional (p)ppGpp synthetase/guanosine-3',5'-bis(diphosphate) 3'-pyrophosphohydrolase [Bacillota bacterium]|nr:bifunctional (p)ppGpp synthetase/guanosine-3',5'-bis(diphosphate) 3'-pyrophosphohydrolase [Bacillota bacterium]
MNATNPRLLKTKVITEALDFAYKAHEGQIRCSGEPFIIHPMAVGTILAELGLDAITVAAGILHDVVEDTDISMDDIKANFGEEIALLVDGVTKLSRIEYKSKEEQQVENLRKMFLAMAKDIRVILIKLADRLHNMRTLTHMSVAKQKEISEETLEIFAPLAHRLGIFRIKWELEDLSFRYLQPDMYYELVKGIAMKRQEREEFICQVKTAIRDNLEKVDIEADIQGRPKNFYSIYKKMLKEQKELNEIYDLLAVRVVVDSIKDCYGALGIIHTLWKPIPGRFKDYIAMPKQNMYQSLHTTLMGKGGEPFEIQIRTWDMHRTAEYGIAAHWRYKESRSGSNDFDAKLSWLRQLLEWQTDMRDAREFMESLKIDVFSDVVYVFTPKGDVVELPAGSVPIDFAYRIHTDIGHRCMGAKINGRIVTLDYRLTNGDIVEILTAKQGQPSRDWLKLVQTSQAKNRIRSFFKREKKEENVIKGKELLEKEVKKLNPDNPFELLKPERMMEAAKRYNFAHIEDLFAAIGDGALTALQVLGKSKDEHRDKLDLAKLESKHQLEDDIKERFSKPSKGVRVRGIDNVLVRLSRCCNPLPGDEIVGYITRGRGVSVHRLDCPNVAHHVDEEQERMIDVIWADEQSVFFQVQMEVVAVDRPRLALDVMNVVAETKTNISSVHARATKNGLAQVTLKLDIKSLEHLRTVQSKVKKIKDVIDVHRSNP